MIASMSAIHPLHVQNIWYDKIASGEKKWEGRLNGSDVSSIRIGDVIDFRSEHREPLKVTVINVLRFPDFELMLEGEGLQRLLPGVSSISEGIEIYRSFPGYSEWEREFGAVIFELEKPL